MCCKHPMFNVTRSVSPRSQADRPPPTSIPGETKALTGAVPQEGGELPRP